jgi:hypothetical protein
LTNYQIKNSIGELKPTYIQAIPKFALISLNFYISTPLSL